MTTMYNYIIDDPHYRRHWKESQEEINSKIIDINIEQLTKYEQRCIRHVRSNAINDTEHM